MREGKKLPSPTNKLLSRIELFDFGLGQDREDTDPKNGIKGKNKQRLRV